MNSDTRTALVTGANRGIGLEIARQLAQQGIHVVGTCRRPEDGLRASETLAAAPGSVRYEVVDVTDHEGVNDLVASLGRIDVLVNNAGVALDKFQSTLDLDPAILRQTLETNLLGPLICCQAVLPEMRERGHGRVVNLSSQLGSLASMTGLTFAYRASKTALNALTRCLADEFADAPDVLINSCCPGWVRTELGGQDAPREPEEAADTPVWLATLPANGPSGGFFQDREPLPL